MTPLPNMVLWVLINCLFVLRSGRSEGGRQQSRGCAGDQPRPRHQSDLRDLRGEVLHAAARLGRGQRGLQEVGEDQDQSGEVAFLYPAQAG